MDISLCQIIKSALNKSLDRKNKSFKMHLGEQRISFRWIFLIQPLVRCHFDPFTHSLYSLILPVLVAHIFQYIDDLNIS